MKLEGGEEASHVLPCKDKGGGNNVPGSCLPLKKGWGRNSFSHAEGKGTQNVLR